MITPKRTRIDLRVSAAERAAIESAAKEAGLTITQYILNALKGCVQDFPLSDNHYKAKG